MNYFNNRSGVLHAEDVTLRKDRGEGRHALLCLQLRHAGAPFPRVRSCVQKNTTYNLLFVQGQHEYGAAQDGGAAGGGGDIVSGGEVYRALRASIPADKIVFSGVGKSPEEIAYAVKSDIAMINVESEGELAAIADARAKAGQESPRLYKGQSGDRRRDAPDITTGLRKNKFGLLWPDARRLYGEIKKSSHLDPSAYPRTSARR